MIKVSSIHDNYHEKQISPVVEYIVKCTAYLQDFLEHKVYDLITPETENWTCLKKMDNKLSTIL